MLKPLGGEEVLVVVPGSTQDEGATAAERLRAEVEACRPGGQAVTISLGIAAATGHDVSAALYQAKLMGRNRVVSGRQRATALAG